MPSRRASAAKREARLLLVKDCGGWLVGLVLRGCCRVEALFAAQGREQLLAEIGSSRFRDELRLAWPPWVAEGLGLQPAEPPSYLGPCSADIEALASDVCSLLSRAARGKQ